MGTRWRVTLTGAGYGGLDSDESEVIIDGTERMRGFVRNELDGWKKDGLIVRRERGRHVGRPRLLDGTLDIPSVTMVVEAID